MNSVALPACLCDQRVIVFDVETTGFDAHKNRVIELGLVWLESGEVVLEFSKLFNPGCSLPDAITKLTGIRQEQVDGAEPFSVVADFLTDVMAKPSILVAYNSPFDIGFVTQEMRRCKKELALGDVLDPLPWVRQCDKGKKCSLTEAAARRGISANGAHRALADCHTTLQVMATLDLPAVLDDVLTRQKKMGNGLRRY